MFTSRFRVVHCLPSAIHLEEYTVPGAFRSCAERRSNEELTDQNAVLSAIDTTKTRIGLVLSLTLVMNDLHRVPNHSTCDACAFHQPAGQQTGSGTKKVPPDAVVFTHQIHMDEMPGVIRVPVDSPSPRRRLNELLARVSGFLPKREARCSPTFIFFVAAITTTYKNSPGVVRNWNATFKL